MKQAVKRGEQPPEAPQELRADTFESFYRVQADGVFRALALTLRDRDLAEEASSEALARAFQHWQRIRSYENPGGWAYRVGFNWAISRRRRDKWLRLRELGNEPRSFENEIFDPDLERALLQLSVQDRAVVVLKYFLGFSQDEIAEALGVRTGTVKSRLSRAIQRLRREVTA